MRRFARKRTARPDDSLPDEHLSVELLEGLAAGACSPPEVLGRAVGHLAARCTTCRRILAAYPARTPLARAAGESFYHDSSRRAVGRVLDLEAEREAAEAALLDELLSLPTVGEGVARVAADPRFQSWGLASVLLDHAERDLDEAPEDALLWVLLAAAVAEALDPALYGEGVVEEMRAVSGVMLARVVLEADRDPEAARLELARAETRRPLAADPELVEIEAELVRLRLLLAEGAWDEVIERAERLDRLAARRHLSEHRLAAIRVGAAALSGAGRLDGAAAAYRVLRAVLAGYGEAPEMERAVRLDLAATLVRADRFSEAEVELEALGPAHPVFDGPGFRARRAWWSGVVAAGLGRREEADELLAAASRGLAAAGLPRESFLALLDRLELLAGAGSLDHADGVLDEAASLHSSATFPARASSLLLHLQLRAWTGRLTEADLEAARQIFQAPARTRRAGSRPRA